MLFGKNAGLDEKIIERTLGAPSTIKDLHAELARGAGDLSLRAVYKAVDKLIAAGALLKVGKKVYLNEEWVRRLRERLLFMGAPTLSEGEKAVYSFTSMEHLDAFWKTIASQVESLGQDTQIFFYNPHNFWAYVPERKASEDAYYHHFEGSGNRGFFTVGGSTPADLEFKRSYQSEFFQVEARDIGSFTRTDHVTIIGNFIISVRLPKKIAAAIDALYASERPIAELLPQISQEYRKPMRIRFVLENNPLRAKKLKRLLSLHFFFWRPS